MAGVDISSRSANVADKRTGRGAAVQAMAANDYRYKDISTMKTELGTISPGTYGGANAYRLEAMTKNDLECALRLIWDGPLR